MTVHLHASDVNILSCIFKFPPIPSNHGSVVHTDFFWACQHVETKLVCWNFHHLSQSIVAGDSANQMHSAYIDLLRFSSIIETEFELSLHLYEGSKLGGCRMIAKVSDRLKSLRRSLKLWLDHRVAIDQPVCKWAQPGKGQVCILISLQRNGELDLTWVTESSQSFQ